MENPFFFLYIRLAISAINRYEYLISKEKFSNEFKINGFYSIIYNIKKHVYYYFNCKIELILKQNILNNFYALHYFFFNTLIIIYNYNTTSIVEYLF